MSLSFVNELVIGGQANQICIHKFCHICGAPNHSDKYTSSETLCPRFETFDELLRPMDGTVDGFVKEISHTGAHIRNKVRRCPKDSQASQDSKNLLRELRRVMSCNDSAQSLGCFKYVAHNERSKSQRCIRD
jgi:hypothetical protein